MDEDQKGTPPMDIATAHSGPRSLHFGTWSIRLTPRVVAVIKCAGAATLLPIAAWLLSEFFQLRGVVDLNASRIVLVFLWLVAFCIFWLLASQIVKSRILSVGASTLLSLFMVVGLDRWAPKPGSAVTRMEAKPTQPEEGGAIDTSSVALFLSCNFAGPLPITIAQGQTLNQLHVPSPIGMIGGRGPARKEDFGSDSFGGNIRRCEVVNDSREPVFNVIIELTLFSQAPSEADAARVPKQKPPYIPEIEALGDHKQNVRIGRIDPNGGNFEFYVKNISKNLVAINPPEFATVELYGSTNQRRRVILRSSMGFPVLSPRVKAE